MSLKNIKIQKFFFLAVVIAVLFLAPTHFVRACNIITDSGNWTACVVTELSNTFFNIIGNIISLLVQLLNLVLHIDICSGSTCNDVVYQSWKIMRDFANMFFIIALIVMAFATIFDISKYSVKTLIAKFLIAALLINFSLTLGILVINGSQSLNNTFITAIGDASLRLGQAANPTQLLLSKSDATKTGIDLMTALLNIVLGIILGGTFLVGILTAVLFALIRIPMVWFLLIISPIAWIASVFPPMQEYYKSWWKQYIGWNLFLPVFLFFLYFGLYFITNKDQILGAINSSYAKQGIGGGQLTLQTIFTYVLSAIFLIGGVLMAFKVSFLSGTSAVKAAGWAKGTAMNTMGFTSMGKAAQMKYQQVKKEGLPGRFGQKLYGGEAGQERRTAAWAERFGVRGAGEEQLAKDISANKKKFANITDAGQLRGLMNRGSKSEQLAIREIMKEKNLLSGQELMDTHNLYGGNKSLAGKQFARSIDFDKLSKLDRERWFKETGDIETKQKIANVMADKGEFQSKEEINKAANLFALEGQQKDLINKTKKGNLKMAVQVLIDRKLIKNKDSTPITDLNEGLKQEIAKMTPDVLLESTKALTKDEDVKKIVQETLNAQKVKVITEKATQEQLDAWGTLIAEIKKGTENEEAAKEAKKSEILADAIVKALRTPPPTPGGTPPTTP